MDDGDHDWIRDDAEHAIKRAEGCGECPDIQACKAEGACLRVLDGDEED